MLRCSTLMHPVLVGLRQHRGQRFRIDRRVAVQPTGEQCSMLRFKAQMGPPNSCPAKLRPFALPPCPLSVPDSLLF